MILLIDDDIDDRALFCEAALSTNSQCETLANGNLMIPKLDSGEIRRPDIIFLDVNMPQINGWECLNLLKQSEAYHTIPVIMYSTSGYQDDIAKAKQLGAAYFFVKPDDFFILQQGLAAVVKHLQAGNLDELSKNSKLFF